MPENYIIRDNLFHIQKHLENRFISIQESLKIVSEALLGLEHAHNNNVLHRDIKPGNIQWYKTLKNEISNKKNY